MKMSVVLVLLFGFSSCKSTEWNQVRQSDDSTPQIFTLVSKQDTVVKEKPESNSGSKAGKICSISKGTKILIQGYTKFADGSHVQVLLSAIQSGSNMSSEATNPTGSGSSSQGTIQSGEPKIVPASKLNPPNPVRIAEPEITDIEPQDFNLSAGASGSIRASNEVNPNDCALLGKTGYLYAAHFDGLRSAEPPIDALFEGYDRDWGNRIANIARNQSKARYSRSSCYMFVADVLERALGRIPNWQPLNRGNCARSFSDGWNPSINESEFRLRKIETRDPNIVDKLPVGTVLVTGRCGLASFPGVCAGPGYGDIMIKGDEEGTMYSAINGPPNSDKCGIRTGNLISVFIPIK